MRPDCAYAQFPITTRMTADNRCPWMPGSKLGQFHRSGFARQVACDFEPGVLKDDRFQLRSAFEQRVEFRCVAMLRHPELHADQGTVAHAAVEFIKASLGVLWV